MRYTPHEYQAWAAKQVVHRRAFALLLAMGLGKTVIILTALNELINERFACGKVLIVAPLRVARETWVREANKWDHLKDLSLIRVLGPSEQRIKALNTQSDVYIINRENIAWLVEYYGNKWPFDTVVIDELSSFKSHTSERFKALRRVRGKISRIYGLTGTPASNGLLDLWAQMFLLDRGERLGKGITAYRDKWFYPAQRDRENPAIVYNWEPNKGASEEIYAKLADISASVESGLVKLPERIDTNHMVTIPMADYNSMVETLQVDGILAANSAVAINKLQQIANGCIYGDDGSFHKLNDAKLECLEDLIEAANGKNVLVYYQYQFDIERILEKFKDSRELRTPASIAAWMDGKINIGVAHAASCGHGLNLQDGGNIIIWYGVPWSLELYQQANARLHRQGQTETVFVHHILARGTVDEDVIDRLHGKDITQQRLLDNLLRRKNG